MAIVTSFSRIRSLVIIGILSALIIPVIGQDNQEEESGGGFFSGLRKMIPTDTKTLKENLDSAWKSGSESFQSLLESGSDANAKMESMLGYLDEKLAGRESAFTDEQIATYATEITPLVEELNHRKFIKQPEVKAVGNFQMIQIMARDLAPQYEKMFPDVSKAVIYLRSYYSASLIAPSLLGKYGAEDHIVYVLPQNLESTMETREIDPQYQDQIMQIVVGHELTHAMQDQEISLQETLLATESSDEGSAFSATIEGHAVFIQNAVADRLGFQGAAKEASQFFVAGNIEEDAWLYERMMHTQAVQFEQVYAGGERFIKHHFQEGGMDRIWEIMDAPPKRSSMITQPETYTPNPEPLPDYNARVKASSMPMVLGDEWGLFATNMGDFSLRTIIAEVEREKRETIMRGLQESVFILMPHKTDLSKSMDVAVFEFDTEQNAELMVEAIDHLSAQSMKDLERHSKVRVRDDSQIPHQVGGDLSGILHQYTLEEYLLGETPVRDFTLRQGNFVVSFLDTGSGLTQVQLDRLIEASLGQVQ